MEHAQGLTRRRLIGGAAATAGAGVALGPGALTAAAHEELPRRQREPLVPRQNIGIQLYSLRDMATANLLGTLDLLAGVGYPEVELFQLHGRTAPQLRALLDERGLQAVGMHVGIDRFRSQLDTVLDEAEALGMPYVGLPGIFPVPTADVVTYRSLAREMNRFGREAADRGMRFYYHNHDFEFARDRGRVLYDVFLDHTDPDLVFFELDTYWIVTAGRDPLDYLSNYDQSRFPLFHVKDRSAGTFGNGTFADLGEGVINFARIFRELENKHYHHYIVERDTQANPARTARVGYEYLRDLTGRRRRKAYAPRESAGRTDARPSRARS